MPLISAVTHVFPDHYYPQEILLDALREHWTKTHSNLDRLERIHRNVGVNGRYLALPMEEYEGLRGWEAKNNAWIRSALYLGESVLCTLFDKAEIQPDQVSEMLFTTVTGIGVPSIDARLMNCIPFSPSLKRVPLFGLGCVAGAAGLARVADYLQGHPDEAAVLLSIELCSLTIQPDDFSVGNLSSSSVLLILEETLSRFQSEPGTCGLLMTMGPAFCAELVLLEW